MTDNKPPHEIHTDRLVLRSAREGDELALQHAINSSLGEFFPWLSFSAQPADLDTLKQVTLRGQNKFAEDEFYVWRVWEPQGELIGTVDLHAINRSVPSCGMGYWLRSDKAGQGLAFEFARAAIDVAWNRLKVERIEVRCDVRNERSWRLAERLGFTFEGIARNDDRDAAGDLCSTKVYSLLPPVEL